MTQHAPRTTDQASHCRGFTLLELLVVVAIMAIVLTIGIPFIRTAIDTPKGMKGAFKVIDDACRDARALAILQQTTVELRIHDDGSIDMSTVGTKGSFRSSEGGELSDEQVHTVDRASKGGGSGAPRKLPESVGIEAILANGQDVTELDAARVHFRANGTCDELQIVLFHPESGERRMVWLDVVTATLDFETDQSKFKLQ